MCSIRCKKSTSNKCTCECQGVFHGILTNQTPGEHVWFLLKMHPPCTPVRFRSPTKRGTTAGKVSKFHSMETGIFVELQGQNHELVKLLDYEFERRKNYENSKTINARIIN